MFAVIPTAFQCSLCTALPQQGSLLHEDMRFFYCFFFLIYLHFCNKYFSMLPLLKFRKQILKGFS